MQKIMTFSNPIFRLSFVMVSAIFFQSTFAQFGKSSLLTNTFSAGPLVSKTGVGLSFMSKINLYEENYLCLDMRMLKHVNEAKIQNPNFTNPRPYIYGKVNSAMIISLSTSRYKILAQSTSNSPALKLGLSFGPTLALLKPYYVYVQGMDNNPYTPKLFIQNPEDKILQQNIVGAAGWQSGLNEVQPKFGFHLDINLLSEWDKNYRLSRFKGGARIDYFSENLTILYKIDERLFTSVYATYQLGGINK